MSSMKVPKKYFAFSESPPAFATCLTQDEKMKRGFTNVCFGPRIRFHNGAQSIVTSIQYPSMFPYSHLEGGGDKDERKA